MDNPPLLYYRTPEQIKEYCRMPTLQKIRKLEMEMELLYFFRLEKLNRKMKSEKMQIKS